MKCPKCDYLGFDTGDRCKNCGYDFSLIEPARDQDVEIDLTLQLQDDAPVVAAWGDEIDSALAQSQQIAEPSRAPVPAPAVKPPALAAAPRRVYETPLPLFTSATGDEADAPLIKLPATPRPPLSVRRTPDTPRLRAVPRPAPRPVPEPALEFVDEPEPPREASPAAPRIAQRLSGPISLPGARLAAAAVDHVLLLGIDLAIVYFTLRMAGLSMADWRMLPVAPLLVFVLLLKLSYFCAFTAVGGQTIGKMAMRIKVVTDEGAQVDGACALRRTIVGLLSTAPLGLGFLPALVASDRRALHDRAAHTRVIALT